MISNELLKRINREAGARDESGRFDRALWNDLASEGLFSLDFNEPERVVKQFMEFGELCDDGGLSFLVGAHVFGSQSVLSLNRESGYFASASEGALIAHAMTEKDAGSNVFAMSSNANKVKGGYRLKGQKSYVSGASTADLFLVYVATDKAKGSMGGISAFILTRQEVKLSQLHDKMGLRSCPMGDIEFDVEVPGERLIGKEGAGMMYFTHGMNWERIGLSAIHVGCMSSVLEATIQFVKGRSVGGDRMVDFQGIQFKIADMAMKLEASRLMTLNAATQLSNSRTATPVAARAKLFVSEAYVDLCREAQQIMGARGYLKSNSIERKLRDALASTIYSGTSEIQKNIIAAWL